MKLTPRKDEVKAIVELLEDDGFESADALAKEIIKRVGVLLEDRELVAWVHRFGPEAPYQLAWGPFSSRSEAERLAKKTGVGGENMILPMGSVSAIEERLKEKPAGTALCTCGHSEVVHQHPGFRGRCVGARGTCKCKKYEPDD